MLRLQSQSFYNKTPMPIYQGTISSWLSAFYIDFRYGTLQNSFFKVLKLVILFWVCCCFGNESCDQSWHQNWNGCFYDIDNVPQYIAVKSTLTKCSSEQLGRQSFGWELFNQLRLHLQPGYLTIHSRGSARRGKEIKAQFLALPGSLSKVEGRVTQLVDLHSYSAAQG